MRNVWTIARREFKLYFLSPVAYVVAFLILLITGIFFVLIINYSSTQALLGGSSTAPGTDSIISIMAILFLLMLPGLTMRLIAGENQSGMMEMLLTTPIHDWELVVGKWLGSFMFILVIIGITLIYPLVLNKLVSPGIDQGLMLANYLGIILLAAAFLSIGTAMSSLFTNQFVAFFATLAVLFFFWWVVSWPASLMSNGGGIFKYLSMSSHFYDTMMVGKVALADVVYFVSFTVLGLVVGSTAVEMRRWR